MVEEPTVLEVTASTVPQESPLAPMIPASPPAYVDAAAAQAFGGQSAGSLKGAAPVISLSALATVVLDWVWSVGEVAQTLSVAGLPTILLTSILLGLTCLVAVTLVQRFIAKDDLGASVAKGFLMGVFAGVPYPIVGTIVGVPLFAWAGIYEVRALLSARRAS